jgi:hypothetical protein
MGVSFQNPLPTVQHCCVVVIAHPLMPGIGFRRMEKVMGTQDLPGVHSSQLGCTAGLFRPEEVYWEGRCLSR